VTHPSVETAQSGEAADAVRTLQAELSGDYSEIRSAEIQLTEAILTAHAVTVSGRSRLQDIQRQLIEAINNPVAALDTPTGETAARYPTRTTPNSPARSRVATC
jgi:hypothetical protein